MTIGCPKQKPFRSEKYLNFVRSQCCCVCLAPPRSEAHHFRTSFNSGVGMKSSDTYCLPLCSDHHKELHRTGIKTFCEKHGIDIYRVLHKLVSEYIKEEL